jgi:hypothetical protein
MDLGNQMTSSMSFSGDAANNSSGYPGQNRGKNVWNYFTNSQFLSTVVEKAKVLQQSIVTTVDPQMKEFQRKCY